MKLRTLAVTMISIHKLLGHEEKLFSLLEASAEAGQKNVMALARAGKALDEPMVLDEFRRLRLIDKKLTEQTSATAHMLFVTALARDDVYLLSTALYKIPKMVDKFA